MNEEPNAEHKSLIKRLLSEKRLNIDEELKIVNQSSEKQFKLVLKSKMFDPKEFMVKTSGQKLIVEALSEEKEMDHTTVVKSHLRYEHLLPKSVNPVDVKAYFPLLGYLQIEAPRIKRI